MALLIFADIIRKGAVHLSLVTFDLWLCHASTIIKIKALIAVIAVIALT